MHTGGSTAGKPPGQVGTGPRVVVTVGAVTVDVTVKSFAKQEQADVTAAGLGSSLSMHPREVVCLPARSWMFAAVLLFGALTVL
jgi:hypothetical protein